MAKDCNRDFLVRLNLDSNDIAFGDIRTGRSRKITIQEHLSERL